MRVTLPGALIALLTLCVTVKTAAQELAPRAYWPAPEGTNVLVTSYQRSEGDVLVDASTPIEGAKAELDFLALSYQHTFNFFERTGSLQLNLPYVRGQAEGLINGDFKQHSISAYGDPRARLAINLIGAPNMNGEEFRELVANPGPIVGASLTVNIPWGKYDGTQLFNSGSNRWAAKPAVGFILPFSNRWLFEGELGTWFYEDNDNYQGKTRSQKPLASTEFHLIRVLKNGTWVSLDANWYQGGAATVGDGPEQAELENSRAGITLVHPLRRNHAIRLALSTGVQAKIAGEYDSFSLSYMAVW